VLVAAAAAVGVADHTDQLWNIYLLFVGSQCCLFYQ
jgi:hypothetical protein